MQHVDILQHLGGHFSENPAVLPQKLICQAEAYSPKGTDVSLGDNKSAIDERKMYQESLSQRAEQERNSLICKQEETERTEGMKGTVRAPSEGKSTCCSKSKCREATLLVAGSSTGTGYNDGEESFHTYSASYSSRPTKT